MTDLPAVPVGPATATPVLPGSDAGPSSAVPEPRAAPEELTGTIWELTLYVTGATMLSARAITLVRQLCDMHLHDRHRLSVVDVSDESIEIPDVGVLAAPSLVRRRPLPERGWYGDLSDADRMLIDLEITGPTAVRPAPNRIGG